MRITIPARTPIFMTLFMAFWLAGWAVGEIMVSRQLLFGEMNGNAAGSLFMTAWLAAWTLGGAWAATLLLWNLAGKEVIELNSTMLRRRKQVPVFGRSREYAVANIANLRAAAAQPSFPWNYQSSFSFLSFGEGTISFDYGRDTHHLGTGLDEADARYVIDEMCKRVKSLCL
jgi:hypothetical protein